MKRILINALELGDVLKRKSWTSKKFFLQASKTKDKVKPRFKTKLIMFH